MKVPQLWQKWDTIRAQTGAFDKINLHGIVLTGSLETLLPIMNFFSSNLSSGSSSGELCAYMSLSKDEEYEKNMQIL